MGQKYSARQMGQKYSARARAATLASCVIATFATAYAIEPLVLWDGATDGYKFDNLTRTVEGATYTLNLNPADNGATPNTVAADASYILIGNNDAQSGVALTFPVLNIANGATVIMRCRDMPVSVGSNRAIITLMDGNKYRYGGTSGQDNGAVVGVYNNAGASGWIWKGSTAGMAGLSGDFLSTATGAFSPNSQIVAFTYRGGDEAGAGSAYYVTNTLIQSNSGLKAAELANFCGISIGGVDVATGSQFYALKGMKIDALAVFSTQLSAVELAAFKFPSQWASEVNAEFGNQQEITLQMTDGASFIGDTALNATKINFVCDGSITVVPPAGNSAAFDFAGVTGNVTIQYNGSVPSVSGDTFTATSVPTWVTDSTKWTGTVAFSGMTIAGPNFNNYGNEASAIKLSGVSGWVDTGTEYTVPIVLENDGYDFAFKITDGNSPQGYNSNENRCSEIRKISGSGSIVDKIAASGHAAKPVIKIYDASGFTGSISLDLATILICDSLTAYSPNLYGMFIGSPTKYNTNGVVRIESSNPMTLPVGTTWKVNAVTFKGSVNFTTSVPLADGLTVFTCDGSALKIDGNAGFSINGTPTDLSLYKVKTVGTELQLKKKVGKRVIFR